jgi:hypothetical protein
MDERIAGEKAKEEANSEMVVLSIFDIYVDAALHAAGFRLRDGRAKPEFLFGTRP